MKKKHTQDVKSTANIPHEEHLAAIADSLAECRETEGKESKKACLLDSCASCPHTSWVVRPVISHRFRARVWRSIDKLDKLIIQHPRTSGLVLLCRSDAQPACRAHILSCQFFLLLGRNSGVLAETRSVQARKGVLRKRSVFELCAMAISPLLTRRWCPALSCSQEQKKISIESSNLTRTLTV